MAGANLLESCANLENAAGVRRHHHVRADLEDVLDLPPLEALRHLRLGEVVTARAAATHVRLGKLDELIADDGFQEFAWLLRDALRVREVAGVVVGDSPAISNFQFPMSSRQNLREVPHFG